MALLGLVTGAGHPARCFGEVPQDAAALGTACPPKIIPPHIQERDIKPISRDNRRRFGSFPAQRCLQVCVKVQVKLENGFKKLCRRVVGRGMSPHPHPESQPPLWG